MDLGETVAEAVVRETREEMGLIVSPGRVVGVDSEPHKAIRIRLGLRHHIVGIVVECTTTGGTLTRSEEALDESWFDPGDLPLLIPSNYERIAHARAGREDGAAVGGRFPHPLPLSLASGSRP